MESSDPVIDLVDENSTDSQPQQQEIRSRTKQTKTKTKSKDSCCDHDHEDTPAAPSSTKKGFNYTAIIMIVIMLLPACIGGFTTFWDWMYPQDAVTRQLRQKLVRCYSVANPEKLDTIDDLLDKYDGKEHILFSKIKSKYPKIDECKF